MSAAVVEVKDDDTFAYYQAYIKDLKDGQVLVRYENGWRADAWVSPHKVRQAVAQHDPASFNPQVGDDVEAMAKSHEDEPFSWWRAKIKTIRGEFYLINYSDWDDTYNEIVEKELLRPPNPNPTLSADNLVKKEIKIPKELWESEQEKADQRLQQHKQKKYKEMQTTSNLLSLIDDPNRHVLMILGPIAAVKKAELMAPMYFKHRKEYKQLHQRGIQKQTLLEEEKKRLNSSYLDEFDIDPQLVGLVIGKKGKNIREAESIPGVISVNVMSELGKVKIVAQNEQAAKEVRARLEYVVRTFPVPKRLMGRVLANKFAAINEIKANSKVHGIRVPSREEQEKKTLENSWGDEEVVDIEITGTHETVANAMILLQQHVAHVQELGDHEQEVRQVDSQLRQLNVSYGLARNMDVDFPSRGGRGGRGGGRGGRGRGGGGRGGRAPNATDNAAAPAAAAAPAEANASPEQKKKRNRRKPKAGGAAGNEQQGQGQEEKQPAAPKPKPKPKTQGQPQEKKQQQQQQAPQQQGADNGGATANGEKRRPRRARKPKGDGAAAATAAAGAGGDGSK